MGLRSVLSVLLTCLGMYLLTKTVTSEHFLIGIGVSYENVYKWKVITSVFFPVIYLFLSFLALKIILPESAERAFLPLVGFLLLTISFITFQNVEVWKSLGYTYEEILKIDTFLKAIGVPLFLIGLAILVRE